MMASHSLVCLLFVYDFSNFTKGEFEAIVFNFREHKSPKTIKACSKSDLAVNKEGCSASNSSRQ